ncbi:hypothetical protein [Actinocrispum wychmicini]|uniref:Uncharacterized protein n=1 Tax=Actinocrispum wychmicini TaxID=1213861 RepID=A0A4R2JCC3_9PSEU|nr:hypothetical protein [Actinocrispum wychmicini]TCO55652.1 hypothetical protein EV192_10774 [Actinocrispum wychmicini]
MLSQRTSPWREDGRDNGGSGDGVRLGMSREDLERYLDEAEKDFRSPDPYRRAEAYALASRLHDELARHTDDPTWKQAARMAGLRYAIEAARIRWRHGIPTLIPETQATLLGLGLCDSCGRPWQAGLQGACPQCPRLRHGATPMSAEQAERLGPGREVDLVAMIAAREREPQDD